MSKLEEYKNNEAIVCDSTTTHYVAGVSGYKEGFDAAIALQLPVKFAEWKENNTEIIMRGDDGDVIWAIDGIGDQGFRKKELYDYWIENILKLEL